LNYPPIALRNNNLRLFSGSTGTRRYGTPKCGASAAREPHLGHLKRHSKHLRWNGISVQNRLLTFDGSTRDCAAFTPCGGVPRRGGMRAPSSRERIQRHRSVEQARGRSERLTTRAHCVQLTSVFRNNSWAEVFSGANRPTDRVLS